MVQTKVNQDVTVPTVCWDCIRGPDLVRVRRVNGIAVSVEGNTDGPGFDCLSKNQGRVCPKTFGLVQKLYNPHRIKGPLKRTNPKKGRGIDPGWVEISWDEALDITAAKLKEIRDRDSLRLSLYHDSPSMLGLYGTWHAFFKAFGPIQTLWSGGAGIRCGSSMHTFANHIHSAYRCHPDLHFCNYLLVVGFNLAASGGVVMNTAWRDAAQRGMKTVVIDPVFTPTASMANEWIPIKPATDLAFLLSLINVICNEIGQVDEEFLKTMTNAPYLVDARGDFARDPDTGKVLVWDRRDGRARAHDDAGMSDPALEGSYFVSGCCDQDHEPQAGTPVPPGDPQAETPVPPGDPQAGTRQRRMVPAGVRPAYQVLKDHVRQYTPEWAAEITEIPAGTIRRIAREYVENARIGSTIALDGITFPYRPVHVIIGRPVEAAMNCYQSVTASHILAALVGCLEVPGGHGGGSVQQTFLDMGIKPGRDGMINFESDAFSWPPKSYDGAEIFTPFAMNSTRQHLSGLGRPGHLSWLNLARPPKNFPMPPPPEAFIRCRTNPLLSIAEPTHIAAVLTRIPFILSISYVHDETTELADIVLPDHTEMERYELIPTMRAPGVARRYKQIALRQPVVEPLQNTRDISDILTGLAERMGMLPDYDRAINQLMGLVEPFKLEEGRRYDWIEIVDRQCKSLSGGARDLEWFKEHSAIVTPLKMEDIYGVHSEMKRRNLRYPIPYIEPVKKKGEELREKLAEVGVDWWDTSAYTALPTYIPTVLDQLPGEYEFFVVTSRLAQFTLGKNIELPWLLELAEFTGNQPEIVMNSRAASRRGIKTGDMVWVESPAGKLKGRVRTREGIRPDTLLIAGQFGAWAMPVASRQGFTNESALVPIDYKWTDPVVGSIQANGVKAKVYKD